MSSPAENIRVMVVDDSVLMRALLIRILGSEMGIRIVASVSDGIEAVDKMGKVEPEVVLLDIEMPRMDGIQAIPKLLQINPDVKIIMVSSYTHAKAFVTMESLRCGAVDFLQKPTAGGMDEEVSFSREITEKVKAWGQCYKEEKVTGRSKTVTSRRVTGTAKAPVKLVDIDESKVTLVKRPIRRPSVIAIGSSTGGPQALYSVMSNLKDIRQPIFITQHMPSAFTKVFAEHLSTAGIKCFEAENNMPIEEGKAYIAPGNFHMCIVHNGEKKIVRLNEDEPENFCRPSVDPMMRSIIQLYGPENILAVILTGMGSDGFKSCQTLVKEGGAVIAQDKETSIVWGMPGAVATAGLCHAVLPLDAIADKINSIARHGAQ